jgi:hypothetical protein
MVKRMQEKGTTSTIMYCVTTASEDFVLPATKIIELLWEFTRKAHLVERTSDLTVMATGMDQLIFRLSAVISKRLDGRNK